MIDAKTIRQIFILLLITATGALILNEMMPYLSGILGAITLYVLLRNPMKKLTQKGWHPFLGSGTLILGSFLVILLPITGAAFMLGTKVEQAINNSEKVLKAIQKQMDNFKSWTGQDLSSQINTSEITSWLSENLQNLAGNTFNVAIAITIMYFLLFYMLINRKALSESLFEYIPLSKENLKILGKESREMVRSNAIGIPLVAVAQGIVALIGFLIFNIDAPFFWAFIVTVGSMIPFVGNMLGTLPVFILSLSNGNTFQAWAILIYGIVIVGATDNLMRLYVLQKLDNVHPLITLIGVIIGIPLFGFIGLIFGPLLVSLFLIVVRIYMQEYGHKEKNVL